MISGRASFFRGLGGFVLVAALGLAAGCDTAPNARPLDATPPRVADFRFDVQTVDDPDASPADSTTALVDLVVALRAADADGRVARVELTLEPSQAPTSTLALNVPQSNTQSSTQYARRVTLRLPLVDDLYTVRAYAVDNDSLLSNQVRGQFRVVPVGEETGAEDDPEA